MIQWNTLFVIFESHISEHIDLLIICRKYPLLIRISKVSLSPDTYDSAGKPTAASHWWSGSSQTCSDWSNPEQWPAERLNTDQCERSSELPYLGLPRHHGAAGGGGEGGGRGLGHPQQVQCRPLSSELSEGKKCK